MVRGQEWHVLHPHAREKNMFILPVLDLLEGSVVRGVAGRRESYRPILSQICSSAKPLAVATAFRERFGLNRLYVADLDGILHGQPNFDTYRQLSDAEYETVIDAGIQDLESARAVFDAGAGSIIAGLESTLSPALLGELVRTFGSDRVVFSLDLQAGQPIIGGNAWRGLSPLEIAEFAMKQGIRRLIVLDLAQVGIAGGVSTLELCQAIRELGPELELITGGGVRDAKDLQLLAKSSVNGVLIASALHDGRLSREDLDSVCDHF